MLVSTSSHFKVPNLWLILLTLRSFHSRRYIVTSSYGYLKVGVVYWSHQQEVMGIGLYQSTVIGIVIKGSIGIIITKMCRFIQVVVIHRSPGQVRERTVSIGLFLRAIGCILGAVLLHFTVCYLSMNQYKTRAVI